MKSRLKRFKMVPKAHKQKQTQGKSVLFIFFENITGLSLRFQVSGDVKFVAGGTKRKLVGGGRSEACPPPQKILN